MEDSGITNRSNQYSVNTEINQSDTKHQRRLVFVIAAAAVIILTIFIATIYFLLSPNTDIKHVARIRDVFIILMALESLLIGLVLILLMIQITRLVNLLNNEIRPILDSTTETVSTLRGTTAFLSNNFVEPVIKVNEYFAGIKEFLRIFRTKK